MTAWHRVDDHGIPVTFTYEPDERGNVTLTTQELEGLMRTGGWTNEPPSFADQIAAMSIAAAEAKFGVKFPKETR